MRVPAVVVVLAAVLTAAPGPAAQQAGRGGSTPAPRNRIDELTFARMGQLDTAPAALSSVPCSCGAPIWNDRHRDPVEMREFCSISRRPSGRSSSTGCSSAVIR
jgi:hypothetical protein